MPEYDDQDLSHIYEFNGRIGVIMFILMMPMACLGVSIINYFSGQ